MYQVQSNVHIIGTTLCLLEIFTMEDLAIVDVPYDNVFVISLLTKLDAFFHEHFRMAYLNKQFYVKE